MQTDDKDRLISKLSSEKKDLEEKCKSLAEIIEVSSTMPTPQVAQGSDEMEKKLKAHIDTLQGSLKSLEKKVESAAQKPAPAPPDLTPIISKIDERLQALNNIPVLEQKLKVIETRLTDAGNNEQGRGLFGSIGGVDMNAQRQSMSKATEAFNDLEAKISTLESRVDDLEKLSISLRNGLNPKTVQVLNEISDHAGSILDEAVPEKVSKEVDKILTSFSSSIASLSEEIRELADRTEKSNRHIDVISQELEGYKKGTSNGNGENLSKEMLELIKALTLRGTQLKPVSQ